MTDLIDYVETAKSSTRRHVIVHNIQTVQYRNGRPEIFVAVRGWWIWKCYFNWTNSPRQSFDIILKYYFPIKYIVGTIFTTSKNREKKEEIWFSPDKKPYSHKKKSKKQRYNTKTPPKFCLHNNQKDTHLKNCK